jgi:uncharacterized membrane protein SpoIIM required for sporulation
MQIDTFHFTPALSLAGGVLIGLAAAWLVAFNGRIAGSAASSGAAHGLRRRARGAPHSSPG